MISTSDNADQAIEKTINKLCRKLETTAPGNEEFTLLVDAISKLRRSQRILIMESSK